MLLRGIILICSLSVTPDVADCTAETAIASLTVPGIEYWNSVSCQRDVQAYFAGTEMARWTSLRLHFRRNVTAARMPNLQFRFLCEREKYAETDRGEQHQRVSAEILGRLGIIVPNE